MSLADGTLIARVYETLVEACTKPPAVAGMPPPGGADSQYVVMQYPAQVVDPKDVANPWTPPGDGDDAAQAGRERLSRMVDVVPNVDKVFNDTGTRVEEWYRLIVEATVQQDGPSSGAPGSEDDQIHALRSAYDNAVASLNANRDQYDLTNPPEIAQWNAKKAPFEKAVSDAFAKLKAAQAAKAHPRPPAPSPISQRFSDAKRVFEQTQLIAHDTSMGVMYHPAFCFPSTWADPGGDAEWSSVTIAVDDKKVSETSTTLAKPEDAAWKVKLTPGLTLGLNPNAPKPGQPHGGGFLGGLLGGIIPPNIGIKIGDSGTINIPIGPHSGEAKAVTFTPSEKAAKTPTVLVLSALTAGSNSRFRTALSQPESSAALVAAAQQDGVSEVHSAVSTDTKNVRASFDFIRVGVVRPWYDASLAQLPGWSIGGFPAGKLSNGSATANPGTFPMRVVAFVAVRNLTISAAWSTEDANMAQLATTSSDAAALSGFRVDKSLGSSFDGATLRIPGLQIIAWLCVVNPLMPPVAAH